MNAEEKTDYKAERDSLIAENKLTLKAEFIPFSRSRNKDEKTKSGKYPRRTINWKVTLLRDGREVVTTDYSQGIGHIPCIPQHLLDKMIAEPVVIGACERGVYKPSIDHYGERPLPQPKIEDILYSLLLDSDVIDFNTYESWASDFGYDPDSRKGEAIYRACLEIALKMRNGLGEKLLSELRDSFQDY